MIDRADEQSSSRRARRAWCRLGPVASLTLLLITPGAAAQQLPPLVAAPSSAVAPDEMARPAVAPDADGTPSSAPGRSEPLFYHGQDYGSESQFGPLNVFVNVGLGVSGRLNASARLVDIDFGQGLRGLRTAYFDPGTGIRRGYGSPGVWAFLEFTPVLGTLSWPNYALHFLGEGMLSRKIEEYYLAQDISPIGSKILAIATITASQQMNEIVEQGFLEGGDALADLVFNTLGVLAFSFDGFARLFANEKVQLYYWPDQAAIDVRDSALFNHGENYMLRTTLGGWTSWKLAIAMGLSYLGLGTSIPVTQRDFLTIGAFLGASNLPSRNYVAPTRENLFYYDEDSGEIVSNDIPLDPRKIPTFRAFWDRQGSLMASLEVGYEPDFLGRSRFYLGANVYPGLLEVGPVKLGGYAAYLAPDAGAVGVTVSVLSVVPGYRI